MWVSSIRLCLNQPCFLYPQRLNLVKSLSTHREENKFKYIYLPNTRARIPPHMTRIYPIISIHKTCFFFSQFKNSELISISNFFIAKKKKTIFCDVQITFSYKKKIITKYAVFWSPANRAIGKTALIGDWFSTKMAIWDL